MKNKRIISILTLICILFSFNINIFAEEENYNLTSLQYEAYSMLKTLGFIDDYYTEETIIENGNVSRAVFSEILCNTINKSDGESKNIYFHDVPANHYAFGAISTFTDLGIISVNDERLFYPENDILTIEATKMIVYGLGYGTLCELKGGDWTVAVLEIANKLKLFSGIKFSEKLTLKDALVLIYNAVNAELIDIKINGIDLGSKGSTYLERYYDIYSDNGTLKAYNGASIYGEVVDENDALIDDMLFRNVSIDIEDFLGKKVKYYYKKEDDENQLVWVGDLRRSKEIKLNYFENIVSFDEDKFSYSYSDENGGKKTRAISSNPNVIYNGAYLKDNITDILSKDLFSVKLIATDGNNYDVVIIEDYDNYYLESLDISDNSMYVKSTSGVKNEYRKIELDDYETETIILPDNSIGSLSDLTKNTVLSIFETYDKSKIEIYVSTNTVEGTVKQLYEENGYQFIEINDAIYNTHYGKNNKIDTKIGNDVKLYIDVYGYIAGLGVDNSSTKFAYLIKGALDDSKLNNDFMVRVFKNDGEFENLKVAKKVTIDGKKMKNLTEAYNEMGGKYIKPQLIVYKINSENEIIMIDRATPYDENAVRNSQDKLMKVNDFESLQYVSFHNQLGKKLRIGPKTTLMSISSDVSNQDLDEYFAVGTSGTLSHQAYYNVEGYIYNTENSEFCDIILFKDIVMGSEKFLSTRVLIDKVKKSVNEDMEDIYIIKGYHGNTYKELYCTYKFTEKNYTIQTGDIIAVSSMGNNKVNDIEVVYGPSTTNTPISPNFTGNGARTTIAYVHDVVGSSVLCDLTDGSTWSETFSAGTSKIFVYNSKENKVYIGSVNDIVSYKQAGTNCSKIFIYIVNGEVRNFVVYK